jgi:PST family polysaccharide transporter
MLNKIKSLTNTEDKKRLFSNFFSLLVLQGANYILPLLTLPYLIRVLGVEYFGLLAFATATVTYFNILTDYGFNLTATKEISIHRNNKEKILEIFSSVMTIKIILMLVSLFLLTVLVFSFEKFSKDWEIYFYSFGIVVGQVLFPIWFFQGMERMKYITYLNILAKSIFTVAVFVFIQEKDDFYLVPILTSLGFIIVGIWSLILIKKEFNISFKIQSLDTIKYYFKDGWDVFVSRIFVSLYTTINTFLLGIFTNNTVVGYYAIAERIVGAVGGLFIPANQTIYPFMAKIYKNQKEKFFSFTKKISISYLLVSILLLVSLYTLNEFILYIITGKVNKDVLSIYNILIFILITVPFGPLFTQVLIIQKKNKEFNIIVRNAFIFNLLITPIMIYFFGAIGLSITVVILQLFVIYLCLKEIKKGLINARV